MRDKETWTVYEKLLLKHLQSLSAVDPATGCWIWISKKRMTSGYPVIRLHYRNMPAHRVSYELHYGPLGNLMACHKCDVKLCINPEHLFAGTAKDNAQDASKKGRLGKKNRGSLNPRAILDEERVKQIRTEALAGTDLHELADRFGIRYRTLIKVTTGETWKHVV